MMQVSVVISARNEFPNIVHTVHSIINDLETFLDHDEFEIIIVDNGSTEPLYDTAGYFGHPKILAETTTFSTKLCTLCG